MRVKKALEWVYFLLRLFYRPFLYLRYGLRCDRKLLKYAKKPCLIVSNHQTVNDQFIIGVEFKYAMNFVSSDSLMRLGFVTKILQRLARIIPITKGTSDASAIKNTMSVIKDGGAVCIFSEGNRTFFGETGNFKSTLGKLAKKLNVPLVITIMKGGFLTAPRWGRKANRGRMYVGIKRVVSPRELDVMTPEEINDLIKDSIYNNDYEYNKIQKIRYKGKHKAEYIEAALFACPECKHLDKLHSSGRRLKCEHCGAEIEIDDYGFFNKINGSGDLPKEPVEWSKKQLEIVKAIDFEKFSNTPLFSDDNIELYDCIRYKKQAVLAKGKIAFYNDRIDVAGQSFKIEKISELAIVGINKLQIITDDAAYMVKCPERINLLKYMVCAYQVKHNNNQYTEEGFYGY